jgi:hypothetical protein
MNNAKLAAQLCLLIYLVHALNADASIRQTHFFASLVAQD